MVTETASYRLSPDRQVEAMFARFRNHVYPPHSHDAYLFGVTEAGAQEFRCRGERHVSAAGMVMAFNPDDVHDGHAASSLGYHYRMLHVSEALVADVLADAAGHRAPMPLFDEPVVADEPLADAVRALHRAVIDDDSPGGLGYDECVTRLVVAMVRKRATREPIVSSRAGVKVELARARLLDDPDVNADELAAAAGCSRFALYRAFRAAYGMSPSQFQRQTRLRSARKLIRSGRSLSDVAATSGFADQSHLTRWFSKVYGITPGTYQAAATAS
jgi:AraC-like DNA-binding protein